MTRQLSNFSPSDRHGNQTTNVFIALTDSATDPATMPCLFDMKDASRAPFLTGAWWEYENMI